MLQLNTHFRYIRFHTHFHINAQSLYYFKYLREYHFYSLRVYFYKLKIQIQNIFKNWKPFLLNHLSVYNLKIRIQTMSWNWKTFFMNFQFGEISNVPRKTRKIRIGRASRTNSPMETLIHYWMVIRNCFGEALHVCWLFTFYYCVSSPLFPNSSFHSKQKWIHVDSEGRWRVHHER